MDWFEQEEVALEALFRCGEITREEYQREMRALRRDAREEEERAEIIAAGRGHLLRRS